MTLNIKVFGQGKPLVFFHGWGFDHRIWLSLVPYLTEHYRLYLVDLPGFGGTELMDWVMFKKQLLHQLPNQFSLIGWSLGGLYATRLALELPNQVSHLVNITSSPYFIQSTDWPGITAETLNKFMERLLINPEQTRKDFIALQARGNYLSYEYEKIDVQALQNGLEILAGWDLREQLMNAAIPVCYMFGRLDAITPSSTLTAMQKIYSDFSFVLFKKAAHMPFISHQEEFLLHLEGFLQ